MQRTMRYALQPRHRRYVRGYGFMSFAKNLAKRGLVSTAVRTAVKRLLMVVKY